MGKAIRCCQECGGPLPTAKANGPRARFCSIACRKVFNNRRMTRGAVLYDLFMMVRYERSRGDMSLMSTIARAWHDEDEMVRAGRKSWASPGIDDERDILTEVLDRHDKAVRTA